jgi:hypothetical protein
MNPPYEVVLRMQIQDGNGLAIIRSVYAYGPRKPAVTPSVGGTPAWVTFGDIYVEIVGDWLEEARVMVLKTSREALADKADQLLDVRAAFDLPRGQVVYTHVFSNRDTALLFKLSQG